MFYEVSRKPRSIKNELLDRALNFACDYLDLDIDMILQFENMKDHQMGLCDYEEDEVLIILSRSLSPDDLVRVLFHELVHVKQYVDGSLKHGGIWKGKEWIGSYVDCPWELEAYELEEEMVNQFAAVSLEEA